MRETSESLIHLDHVSSSVFYSLLEFSFHDEFKVPQEELDTHIQVCKRHITMTTDPAWTSHAHICKSGAVVLPFFSPSLTLEVSSYLLAQGFLSKCLSFLADELSPANCLSYLSLAQEICCVELKKTVLTYLGRNLLEMPQLIKYAMMYNV